MTTLLVAAGVLALFGAMSFSGWRIHRRQPHHVLERIMRQMSRDLEAFAVTLGEALLPAVVSAGEAFAGFAAAWRGASHTGDTE